jgi:hypothetical protein
VTVTETFRILEQANRPANIKAHHTGRRFGEHQSDRREAVVVKRSVDFCGYWQWHVRAE